MSCIGVEGGDVEGGGRQSRAGLERESILYFGGGRGSGRPGLNSFASESEWTSP